MTQSCWSHPLRLAGSSEYYAMVSPSVTHNLFNMKASSMLVPSTTHRDSLTCFLFLFCLDYQPGCDRYAFSLCMSCRPPRMQARGSGFLDTFRFAPHLLSYHGISDDYLLVLLQAGMEPVLFLTVLTCYTTLSIVSRPKLLPTYLYREYVRYIYYACVKCRITPRLDLLLHNVETMVPSWTAPPRWPPGHQTEVGAASVCILNVLNNSLIDLHSLAATTLSTAHVRPMVLGLSGRKRPHWVSDCYRMPDEHEWLTSIFRCDMVVPCHWEYAYFSPGISFYLTIIFHLGFLENSTLIDMWTLNQERQSALTTNVSESF